MVGKCTYWIYHILYIIFLYIPYGSIWMGLCLLTSSGFVMNCQVVEVAINVLRLGPAVMNYPYPRYVMNLEDLQKCSLMNLDLSNIPWIWWQIICSMAFFSLQHIWWAHPNLSICCSNIEKVLFAPPHNKTHMYNAIEYDSIWYDIIWYYMINLCIYVQLLFISNHNMGCVSILTFQNVIHPQTAVFRYGNPIRLKQSRLLAARCYLGRGVVTSRERESFQWMNIFVGGYIWYINSRNLLKTFLNRQKTGRR